MRLIAVMFVAVLVVAGCSSDPEPQSSSASYCAVVAANADAMMGTDPTSKRPAMFALRDAAPAELRGDWDTFVADTGDVDVEERDLARQRIAEFESANC